MKEELTMLAKELPTTPAYIQKMLNDKYGVDEKIIALLSSEQARKDFNNLKPKNKQ